MSRATVDPSNPAIIQFDEPVTLQEAIRHLWGSARLSYHEPLRPFPGELSHDGGQRRFLIDIDSPGLLRQIQDPSVYSYYDRRLTRPLTAAGGVSFPEWVPESVRQRILSGDLRAGATRFQAPRPWAGLVVWYARGQVVDAQVYLEFPEDLTFYEQLGGDSATARLIHRAYRQFNRDMRYFVEERGYAPNRAREEIRRINDQCFRMILEMSATILAAGAGMADLLAAMRANARPMAALAGSGRRPITTHMTREGVEGILSRATREQRPEVPENVYLGRGVGREEYVREWVNHGGTGEPPRYGFEVRDQRGRIVERVGYQSPEDANAAVHRNPVPDMPHATLPTQTTAGVRGTRLETINRARFVELRDLDVFRREPARLVRFVQRRGGPDPDYLRQWVDAGGQGSPPAEGFAVWSPQLDEVLKVVVPYKN